MGPRMYRTDLEAEFARTGLAKSALAAFLHLPKSAISRAVSGARPLERAQIEAAKAFFSIVPVEADGDFVQAVRKLRSDRVRSRVGAQLVRLWRRRGGSPHRVSELREDIYKDIYDVAHRVEANQCIFRADQIVILARWCGANLVELVGAGKPRRDPDRFRAPRQQRGLQRAQAAGLDDAPPGIPVDTAEARDHHRRISAFERCGAVVNWDGRQLEEKLGQRMVIEIKDVALEPDFAAGDLLLADSTAPVRRGDWVVVTDRRQDARHTLLGRLVEKSEAGIALYLRRYGDVFVRAEDVGRITRIGFRLVPLR